MNGSQPVSSWLDTKDASRVIVEMFVRTRPLTEQQSERLSEIALKSQLTRLENGLKNGDIKFERKNQY